MKSYPGYFSNDLEQPHISIKVTSPFDAEYLRNGTRYRHTYNGILIQTYTCPTQGCHFIFNDTKHRAVSLRQLSLLSDSTTKDLHVRTRPGCVLLFFYKTRSTGSKLIELKVKVELNVKQSISDQNWQAPEALMPKGTET